MNKAQYDDVYLEWMESSMLPNFDDEEEAECYARILARLHN